ncbi:MAG: hypothetical protein ACK52E_16295 [Aphanizomenon sp.]|jgi:hypothetical protein
MNSNSDITSTECLESIHDLKCNLLALTNSPVKADTTAITRIEMQSQKTIADIINDLDDLVMMINGIKKNDSIEDMISKSITGIIRGILFGAIASLILLIFKPEITRPAFCLSFLIGVTSSYLKVEK